MRIALIAGIDYYDHSSQLFGCVADARAVSAVLQRHGDGSVNFDCKLLTGTAADGPLNRDELKDRVTELFKAKAEIALFYFAGHGHVEATGGYLLGTDARRGDEGLSLDELITLANASESQNKVIILDSCHSGIAGTHPGQRDLAAIAEGVTVLTASTADQYASEENGSGVFTSLLVDALYGGAGNLSGEITPGSVYAYIDQSLGAWEQRPVFKTNVRQFVSLRTVPPPISLEDLRRIAEFFPAGSSEYQLDPTYEPELKGRDPGMPPPDAQNVLKFAILQKYNRLNLVVPVGVPHMWNAAMQGKPCKLTALGEHYRRLAVKKRI